MWIQALGSALDPGAARGLPPIERLSTVSQTPLGPLRHLAPVVTLSGVDVRWTRPSVPLGHDAPVWLPRDPAT